MASENNPTHVTMSSIGLGGGLGRQIDRTKLIEDYSKPEILYPIHRNFHRDPSTLEPSNETSTKLPPKPFDIRAIHETSTEISTETSTETLRH